MGLHRPWEDMKRCVLNTDGTVNYYLDPTDSTKKADGTAAVLDGTDGNVMVEVPRFFYKTYRNGDKIRWSVRTQPFRGYQVHPAFIKAGVGVPYRYVGAYDACYWDATDSTYKSGLNLDDMTSSLDLSNDKMASVSGVYPLVGVTRDECRSLAENNGTGWHQLDFALWSALQMLYLVEYGTFDSQTELGDGNVNGTYVSPSSSQSDSPHTIAGASNSWGNASTDDSQPSAGAKPGTAYMSYRGVENIFGNCWNWVDGINVNQGTAGTVYYTNDYTDFADNTTTNYTEIATALPTSTGYTSDILGIDFGFLSSSNSGGSSSTYLTDYHYASSSLDRVVAVGGIANSGTTAGLFRVDSNVAASYADRAIGARLAF